MKLTQHHNNGLLMWSETPLTVKFSDLFEVKVGCVAKSKKLAYLSDGVPTVTSGETYNYDLDAEWIRPPNGTFAEVFCRVKTRREPFFYTYKGYEFDGSVLGLIPTEFCQETFRSKKNVVEFLNTQDYLTLGFTSPNGRYQFGQRSLSNVLLNNP